VLVVGGVLVLTQFGGHSGDEAGPCDDVTSIEQVRGED
jgi:hypothetical protein